jgi:hypothetical protein
MRLCTIKKLTHNLLLSASLAPALQPCLINETAPQPCLSNETAPQLSLIN